MNNKFLKGQRGFAASDTLIAILIIALFSGLIASISYNIYLANSSIKRMSKANSYVIDVFEYIDKNYYEDITEENLVRYFNNKYYYEEDGVTPKNDAEAKTRELQDEIVSTPFKVELNVIKYNETEGNTDKFDLVKEITMKVSYKLGNKNQEIEMKRIKRREKLESPNKPNLNLVELQEGEKLYCIKKINDSWKICNSDDENWYNYKNGNWAIILKTTRDLKMDEEVDVTSLLSDESIYAWIPRYAYDDSTGKIVFLYSNSNSYVENNEEYTTLISLSELDNGNYEVLAEFKNGEQELLGIWTNDTNTEAYQVLNNEYPLQQ